mgnify:CR=1 FL=1
MGTTLGGKLLNMNPLFSDVQLHNYLIILLIAGVINLLSLIWECFMIDQQRDRKKFYEEFSSEDNKSDIELSNVENKSHDMKTEKDDRNYYKKYENQNPIRLLFDCGNIVEIVKTCFKKRPTSIRAQIWLIFLSMLMFNMSREGLYVFLFQFVERVYQWNAEEYSYASSIATLVNVIFLLTVIPFIIKVIDIN